MHGSNRCLAFGHPQQKELLPEEKPENEARRRNLRPCFRLLDVSLRCDRDPDFGVLVFLALAFWIIISCDDTVVLFLVLLLHHVSQPLCGSTCIPQGFSRCIPKNGYAPLCPSLSCGFPRCGLYVSYSCRRRHCESWTGRVFLVSVVRKVESHRT